MQVFCDITHLVQVFCDITHLVQVFCDVRVFIRFNNSIYCSYLSEVIAHNWGKLGLVVPGYSYPCPEGGGRLNLFAIQLAKSLIPDIMSCQLLDYMLRGQIP